MWFSSLRSVVARSITATGETMRIDGVPIIDKPALFHWIQAGSFAIFGENELGARMPTALAALALLGITYWFGKRLFGPVTGERAALMLAMMPLSFVLSSFAIGGLLGACAGYFGGWFDRVAMRLCDMVMSFPLFVLAMGIVAALGNSVFNIIIATALVDTGSRMDELIFQEFKGTGNMELILDRKLADRRLFPAIDIPKSGTRKEEKLFATRHLEAYRKLRRMLTDLQPVEAMETLIAALKKHKTNEDLLTKLGG